MGTNPSHSQQLRNLYPIKNYLQLPPSNEYPHLIIMNGIVQDLLYVVDCEQNGKIRAEQYGFILQQVQSKFINGHNYFMYQWSQSHLKGLINHIKYVQQSPKIPLEIYNCILHSAIKAYAHLQSQEKKCLKVSPYNIRLFYYKGNKLLNLKNYKNYQLNKQIQCRIIPTSLLTNQNQKIYQGLECLHEGGKYNDQQCLAISMLQLFMASRQHEIPNQSHQMQLNHLKKIFGSQVSHLITELLQGYSFTQVMRKINKNVQQLKYISKENQPVKKIGNQTNLNFLTRVPKNSGQMISNNTSKIVRGCPNHMSKKFETHKVVFVKNQSRSCSPSPIISSNRTSISPHRIQASPHKPSISPDKLLIHPNKIAVMTNALSVNPSKLSISPNRLSVSPNKPTIKFIYNSKPVINPLKSVNLNVELVTSQYCEKNKNILPIQQQPKTAINQYNQVILNHNNLTNNNNSHQSSQIIQFIPSINNNKMKYNSDLACIPKISYIPITLPDNEQQIQKKTKNQKTNDFKKDLAHNYQCKTKQIYQRKKMEPCKDKRNLQSDLYENIQKQEIIRQNNRQTINNFSVIQSEKSAMDAKSGDLQSLAFSISNRSSHDLPIITSKYIKITQKTERVKFLSGGYYEGQMLNGKFNGHGKLFYPSNQIAYEGEFCQGTFSKVGKLYNCNPTYIQQFNFQNFNLVQERPQVGKDILNYILESKKLPSSFKSFWKFYEGQFKNGRKHGKGILVLQNGQRYQGNFQNDLIHGKGIFSTKDKQIHGEWSQSVLLSTLR